MLYLLFSLLTASVSSSPIPKDSQTLSLSEFRASGRSLPYLPTLVLISPSYRQVRRQGRKGDSKVPLELLVQPGGGSQVSKLNQLETQDIETKISEINSQLDYEDQEDESETIKDFTTEEIAGSDFETDLDEGKNAEDVETPDRGDSTWPPSGQRIELTTPPATLEEEDIPTFEEVEEEEDEDIPTFDEVKEEATTWNVPASLPSTREKLIHVVLSSQLSLPEGLETAVEDSLQEEGVTVTVTVNPTDAEELEVEEGVLVITVHAMLLEDGQVDGYVIYDGATLNELVGDDRREAEDILETVKRVVGEGAKEVTKAVTEEAVPEFAYDDSEDITDLVSMKSVEVLSETDLVKESTTEPEPEPVSEPEPEPEPKSEPKPQPKSEAEPKSEPEPEPEPKSEPEPAVPEPGVLVPEAALPEPAVLVPEAALSEPAPPAPVTVVISLKTGDLLAARLATGQLQSQAGAALGLEVSLMVNSPPAQLQSLLRTAPSTAVLLDLRVAELRVSGVLIDRWEEGGVSGNIYRDYVPLEQLEGEEYEETLHILTVVSGLVEAAVEAAGDREGVEVVEEILEDEEETGGEGAREEVEEPRDAGGAVSDYYSDYVPEETMEDEDVLGQGDEEAVDEVFQAVADRAVEEASEDVKLVAESLEEMKLDVEDVAGPTGTMSLNMEEAVTPVRDLGEIQEVTNSK